MKVYRKQTRAEVLIDLEKLIEDSDKAFRAWLATRCAKEAQGNG